MSENVNKVWSIKRKQWFVCRRSFRSCADWDSVPPCVPAWDERRTKPASFKKLSLPQISSLAKQEELGWREMDCVGINAVWGLSRKLCQSVAGSFITGLGSEQSAQWLLWFIQSSCRIRAQVAVADFQQIDKDLFILLRLSSRWMCFPWAPNTEAPLSLRPGKKERESWRDFRGEEKREREREGGRHGIPGRHQPLLVASQ